MDYPEVYRASLLKSVQNDPDSATDVILNLMKSYAKDHGQAIIVIDGEEFTETLPDEDKPANFQQRKQE